MNRNGSGPTRQRHFREAVLNTPDLTERLRRAGRQRRRQVGPRLRERAGEAVAAAVAARLAGVRAVGAYLADDGEVDLAGAIAVCRRRDVTVAVPRVSGRSMSFARLPRSPALVSNRFGIAEPAPPDDAASTDGVPLAALAFVLAPLVAFDGAGHRLGRGGGYYDRCFSAPDAPPLVGVAFECQRVERIPAAAHDVGLAAIVTEDGWRDFDRA